MAAPPGYIETEVDWQRIQPGISARQTWAQNHPDHYVYDLKRDCCCARHDVRVFVVAGQVVQIEDQQSGEVITDEAELKKYRTLDEYDTWLDHQWQKGADAFMVKRNRHLGYPEEIQIDPSYRMADDEIRENIVRFRLLQRSAK